MRQRLRCTAAALIGLAFAVACCGAASATAKAPSWDRGKSIKAAAERLVLLHRRKGSQGVFTFLDACYKTHLIASDYTEGLESCLAQDYMHTRILTQIYARLPPQHPSRKQSPSAGMIADAMGKRLVGAFTKYNIGTKAAETFKELVDTYGYPVFLKGVFPKAGRQAEQEAAKPKPRQPIPVPDTEKK